MRSWISNQYAWHVLPAFNRLSNWMDRKRIRKIVRGKNNSVGLKFTCGNSSVSICGDRNTIQCGEGSVLGSIDIKITGSDSFVEFGPYVRVDSLAIHIEGDKCILHIGKNSYVSQATLICAESKTKIQIGTECMFACGIEIRTGDAHGLFDTTTRERLNPGADVIIGDRVWIGGGVRILKGGCVADGCVVGAGSIVTKALSPRHSLFVGSPARFVRGGITWGWHLDRFPEYQPVV